jgi:hypothetical protein
VRGRPSHVPGSRFRRLCGKEPVDSASIDFPYRFRPFTGYPESYCGPHAEGAEDTENREEVPFSASSISPRPSA